MLNNSHHSTSSPEKVNWNDFQMQARQSTIPSSGLVYFRSSSQADDDSSCSSFGMDGSNYSPTRPRPRAGSMPMVSSSSGNGSVSSICGKRNNSRGRATSSNSNINIDRSQNKGRRSKSRSRDASLSRKDSGGSSSSGVKGGRRKDLQKQSSLSSSLNSSSHHRRREANGGGGGLRDFLGKQLSFSKNKSASSRSLTSGATMGKIDKSGKFIPAKRIR